MAPIKFEEHAREKLGEREIQPSARSWEKLNSRLDNSGKRSGKKYIFSAVAAVMVLLIASISFINMQDQNSVPVVETPRENNFDSKTNKSEFEQPVQVAYEDKIEKNQNEKKPSVAKPLVQNKKNEEVQSSENNRLTSNSSRQRSPVQPVSKISIQGSNELNSNVAFQMQQLKAGILYTELEKGGEITEAELDALLAEATREIQKERNLNTGNKVNADLLLAEAEAEIYQSVKEKILNVLKDGYEIAVIAVSNRTGQSQDY